MIGKNLPTNYSHQYEFFFMLSSTLFVLIVASPETPNPCLALRAFRQHLPFVTILFTLTNSDITRYVKYERVDSRSSLLDYTLNNITAVHQA